MIIEASNLHASDATHAAQRASGRVSRSVGMKLLHLRLEGDLDFVARVNTFWTMLNLEALLQRRPDLRRGVVIVVPSNLTTPSLVLQETAQELGRYPDVTIVELEPYGSIEAHRASQMRTYMRAMWRLRRSSSGRPMHYISPRFPDLTMLAELAPTPTGRRSPVFHILDEGFGGTPVPGWHSVRIRLQDLARRASRRLASIEEHSLYRPDAHGRYTLQNEKVVESVLARIAAHASGCGLTRRGSRPIALVITSYWAENGWMTEERETENCVVVASRLLELGYSVRIKQHPREKLGRFDQKLAHLMMHDIEILPRDVTAEVFFAAMDPKTDVVVGTISNAQFTATHLFGLRCVVLKATEWGSTSSSAAADERGYLPLLPNAMNLWELPAAGA